MEANELNQVLLKQLAQQAEIQRTARYKDIEFDGDVYRCRIIKDKHGEDLIIGGYELDAALHPGEWEDENEGFASEEAAKIYDEIFYFMDDWDVEFLAEEQIIEEVKEANPDWFN